MERSAAAAKPPKDNRGQMRLREIRDADLTHPRTVADRAAQGDAAFEAELSRSRDDLHAEAQAIFNTDRERHDRLIHKAWLRSRRKD